MVPLSCSRSVMFALASYYECHIMLWGGPYHCHVTFRYSLIQSEKTDHDSHYVFFLYVSSGIVKPCVIACSFIGRLYSFSRPSLL